MAFFTVFFTNYTRGLIRGLADMTVCLRIGTRYEVHWGSGNQF